MSWEAGISDNIKLEAKRIPFKPLKFLYLSICANLINLILGFLSVIGYLFIEKVGETWSSPVWAVNMYGVTNAIARFIQGMWIGLIQYFTPENTAPIPIALILITLPSMAVCAGGYYLGLRGKTIRNLFGIKTGNGTSGMVK